MKNWFLCGIVVLACVLGAPTAYARDLFRRHLFVKEKRDFPRECPDERIRAILDSVVDRSGSDQESRRINKK